MVIEDFRGDFEDVAGLVQRAWADNEQRPVLYTKEFLASQFGYPGSAPSLAPTLYDGARPMAFVAGFPRRIRFLGREWRVAVAAFLSVANEFKRRGYGILLWGELARRVRAAGYDGLVSFGVEGDPMNGMILGGGSLLKIPIGRVHAVSYLSGILWPKEAVESRGPAEDSLIDDFLELSVPIAGRTPLARVWSRDEAEWQCRRRLGAVAVRPEAGPRCGVLTGYVMPVADHRRTSCLLVEDIFWGDLNREERLTLVRRIKGEAAAAGARLAVVPVQGYADVGPFLESGFQLSRRIVQTYLSLWDASPEPGLLDSIYLDVF